MSSSYLMESFASKLGTMRKPTAKLVPMIGIQMVAANSYCSGFEVFDWYTVQI